MKLKLWTFIYWSVWLLLIQNTRIWPPVRVFWCRKRNNKIGIRAGIWNIKFKSNYGFRKLCKIMPENFKKIFHQLQDYFVQRNYIRNTNLLCKCHTKRTLWRLCKITIFMDLKRRQQIRWRHQWIFFMKNEIFIEICKQHQSKICMLFIGDTGI